MPCTSAAGSRRSAIGALVVAFGAVALPAAPAQQTSSAHPRVLAFGDTSGVRVEVTLPAHPFAGRVLGAEIRHLRDSTLVWTGPIGTLASRPGDSTARLGTYIAVPGVRRWSPQTPELYTLAVFDASDDTPVRERVRFGFRTMSAGDGRFLLNGRPLFLRGNAINPPERNIPDSLEENRRFVEAYVRYLRGIGVNIIRLTRHSQVWFDVCDELGMMLFQGNYGTPEGGTPTSPPSRPLAETLSWYRHEVLEPLVNHPSVVVYVLANEQADREIPYLTRGAGEVGAFLAQLFDSLRVWDPSRAYIANAGYGFGRVGDVCDLHRYWGWYYNSFLSFYTLRDPGVCWRRGVPQPITLTENTGNYTGIDGRYNLVSATKQPDSQLHWTGHAPDREQAPRALAYQAWMAGQAIEITRRSRQRNPFLAGLSPFTILFHRWHGITRFEDMRPKPVAEQYRRSFAEVMLSWELWTPHAYPGATVHAVLHLVNDQDDGSDLPPALVRYALVHEGSGWRREGLAARFPALAYYGTTRAPVAIAIPAGAPLGVYSLTASWRDGARERAAALTRIIVDTAPRVGALTRRVRLYDPARTSGAALTRLGVPYTPVSSARGLDPRRHLVVVGAEAGDPPLSRDRALLRRFVDDGGRVVVLHQRADRFAGRWLPVPIRLQRSELDHALVFPGGRPARQGMAVNPERADHPTLAGIDRDRLFLWNDFTRWTDSLPGFPQVYPVTHGFVLSDPSTLGRAAVIANYDHGLEGVALAELFGERGSVLVTGFDLVHRAGEDPVADRLLGNLLRYMGSAAPHEAAPLVTERITWGDYASERGLLTGIYSGLLVHTVPVVPPELAARYPLRVSAEGFAFAGSAGGWNTRPAIQYVARGRRPFGPYTFTAGGTVQPASPEREGSGRVWLRVPASRRVMVTTVQNQGDVPLEIALSVNGTWSRQHVPPNGIDTVRVALPRPSRRGGATPLALIFRGDRRLVLLDTDFR